MHQTGERIAFGNGCIRSSARSSRTDCSLPFVTHNCSAHSQKSIAVITTRLQVALVEDGQPVTDDSSALSTTRHSMVGPPSLPCAGVSPRKSKISSCNALSASWKIVTFPVVYVLVVRKKSVSVFCKAGVVESFNAAISGGGHQYSTCQDSGSSARTETDPYINATRDGVESTLTPIKINKVNGRFVSSRLRERLSACRAENCGTIPVVCVGVPGSDVGR